MASRVYKPNYDFRLEWMKYYKWASPVEHDKYKAYCALCKLTLNISSNGHFSLLQHEKSKAHCRNLSENNGEYWHGSSTQSKETPVECPDKKAGINSDKSIKMGTINDPSSIETVSPSNPHVPLSVRNDKNSSNLLVMLTDIPILHETYLPNRNSTVDDSSSLQNTNETLDSVRNTHKSNNGSRSDLPEINGCSENSSKFRLSNATKNSSPELLDITTSRATVSSPNREQSICPAYKDNKLSDVSVILEPIPIGTKMDTPSSHLPTPGPSKAMKQTVESIEMKFEIDNNYPSVSSPIPTEQALGMHSNNLNSRTGMNATLQNAEMARETPEAHFVCEAGNTESFNRQRSCGEENSISTRLLAHTNTYGSETDESGLSKRRCLPARELPVRSHSITRDKSYFLNEIRSILERLDEAKLVYENKCRTIMEDYKILLYKLSEESDPTFAMSEYVNSWNSLKLLRMLYNEANSSEKLHPDGQPDNNSSCNGDLSTSRGFSCTQGFLHNGQIRKRGRPRKQVQYSQ